MTSYSGICVIARPGQVQAARTAVAAMASCEVYAEDEVSHKLVIVQEGRSLDEHEEGLRRIRDLAPVLTADLVYHLVDDGTGDAGASDA